jgi:small neutral amino acid transporter SnatA (MarC family)
MDGALTVALLVVAIILSSAERIRRLLGERALIAFERLMGLILTAMAVEMLLAGVRKFAMTL